MGTDDVLRTCPFCEASCGLELQVENSTLMRVRGDRLHPDSKGFLCPKASALKWLHEDPDRIRQPLMRTATGWEAVSWERAFEYANERLTSVLDASGLEALAVYIGNPASYNLDLSLFGPHLYRLARQRFSPSTVDTFPLQFANGLIFGGEFTIPVPDVDRTEEFWILGANPSATNGSMMVTPDINARLAAICDRGGRVVVFDPRRTATAERATEHYAIRPGTDALFLAAVIHTLFDEQLLDLKDLAGFTRGVDVLKSAVSPFDADAVASSCHISADDIRRLTRRFASASAGVVYGRLGTCTQEFGTITSWFVTAVNVLTGNLDRPGGAMFGWPVSGSDMTAPGGPITPRRGRWSSRVRGAPELMGELPVACLAEEISVPGAGQIRALLTVAGNPALSVPDARLREALEGLDFHLAIDLYLNETSSTAHLILPGEGHLHRAHFPLAGAAFMSRQVARWTPPTLAPEADRPRDWEVMLRLWAIVTGRGLDVTTAQLDDELFGQRVDAAVHRPGGPIAGRSREEILELAQGRGPERVVDFLVRTGPYGDEFGASPTGVTLSKIQAHPHGLDLGVFVPRLPGFLRTSSGCIELAPQELVDDLQRLSSAVNRPAKEFVMIGRRDLRTNNSWMHNLPALARGRDRSRLQMSPNDADRLGLETGSRARVSGAIDSVDVDVEVFDGLMDGVVSLPHGWGHDWSGTHLSVASERPGVNANVLADPFTIDELTGTSIVNGFEVSIQRLPSSPENG